MNIRYPLARQVVLGLLCCMGSAVALAQNPAWHMAAVPTQTTGSSSFVASSALNTAGDVYLTGWFSGTVSFGPTSLTSAGGTDVFVAKWSPATSSFVWAQRGGGAGDDTGKSVAVVGGNVYVAGNYNSPQASFGAATLDNQGVSQGMYVPQDVFITKLVDAGSTAGFGWAQRVSGPYTESVAGLAVSGSNVYIAGEFSSPTLTLGAATLTNSSPAATASTATADLFVAQLNDMGNGGDVVWAERAGGPNRESCVAMTAQGNNIYLHGQFWGSSTTIGATTLTNAATGTANMYVAKLTDNTSSRQWAWAVQAGTAEPFANNPSSIAVVGTSVYVTGSFANQGPAVFGPLSLRGVGNMNMFLAKLTDAGNSVGWTWARTNDSGSGSIRGYGLLASTNGVYWVGDYYASAVQLGSISLPVPGSAQVVPIIARLTDAGATSSYNWVQVASGGTGAEVFIPALAGQGQRLYAMGWITSPSATFGSYTVTVPNASTPAGSRQAALLVGLTDNTPLRSTDPSWAADLHLVPNPAHDRVRVTVPAVGTTRQATLTLTDALGRVVRTTTLALPAAGGQPQDLELRGLAPGLYVLRVQAGPHYALRPLLVE